MFFNFYHKTLVSNPIFFPSKSKLESIINQNRKTLDKIPFWIEDEVYQKSIYLYGLPKHVRHLIDKKIGKEPTYTDIMLYYADFLKKPINYLELGVSVGKNFFQIASYLKNSTLTGFDIENINPTLKHFFTFKKQISAWKTPKTSLRKNISSFDYYKSKLNNNSFYYLTGDIYDKNAWKQFEGKKFNLIISDASHSDKALFFEYKMMEKYNLLDDEFIIIWDDLNKKLRTAFTSITNKLMRKHDLASNTRFIKPLNGWLGKHEEKHPIGFLIKISK